MKQINKEILTRFLALFLTICMLVQAAPMDVFATELKEKQTKAAIEEQMEKIEQLKEEKEFLIAAQQDGEVVSEEIYYRQKDYVGHVDEEEEPSEDKKPVKDEDTNSPQSGDENNVLLWANVMIFSILAVIITIRGRKKHEQ